MGNLDNAVSQIGKINALTECIEDAMLDAAAETGLNEKTEKLHNLVYVLMDEQEALAKTLEAIQGDAIVCDVILCKNHVEKLKTELAELKAKA